jgi:outer membrane protein TolC
MLGVVAACGLAAGCRQQVFLDRDCFQIAHNIMPPQVETDFHTGNQPLQEFTKSPATLNDPDRPAWNMTLHEAYAIALENGSVGDAGGAGVGNVNDSQAQFAGSTGGSVAQTDRLKALAMNPALQGANLEASLARFDTQFITTMSWSNTDEIQQSAFASPNGQNAFFNSGFVKALPTGGTVGTSFETNYRFLDQPNVNQQPNQLYEARLRFGFEQPLLRNFGVELNEILNAFPTFNGTGISTQGAQAFNQRQAAASNIGLAGEGILISRIRLDQQRAEFERRVQNLLLNVEVAYWRLYEAYGELYANEEILRIAHKSWVTNHAKFLAGTIGPANYYPIRAQYEEFRGARITALGLVLERERNLRGLLGLPVEDGKRIVPLDPPQLAPFQPNWDAAVQMAIMQKPELAIVRDNLRVAQYQLVQQKNFLRPDLRFSALYSPVGFGNRLDGNDNIVDGAGNVHPSNALRSLASDHFNEWSMGLTLSVPLGYRLEHASVRAARLQLAQSYYLLKDQEDRAQRVLTLQYQKIFEWYNQIEANRAERKAYGDAVEARFREFAVGKTTVSDFLLDAMRRLVAAQVKEYTAISEYNNSLARFEWAKGNAMKHNNVLIADGALPCCAEVRAVDHERERAKAIILRERPDAINTPALCANKAHDLPAHLEIPASVPPVMNTSANTPSGIPVGTTVNGVTMLGPVDATPSFRSVPTAGASVVTPPVETVPAVSDPTIINPGAAMTPNLRAAPRN